MSSALMATHCRRAGGSGAGADGVLPQPRRLGRAGDTRSSSPCSSGRRFRARSAGALDSKIALIRDQLAEAESLRKEAQALKAEYEEKAKSVDKDREALIARARHEADEIVAKAKTDAEALIERRTRMAEDKIAAEERSAVEQLRAAAAGAAARAAARLIAERHDAAADARWSIRRSRKSALAVTAAGSGPCKRMIPPAFAGAQCLLPVLAAGLTDAFERFGAQSGVCFTAEVAEADDAAQPLVLVDHRQAADLRLAHLGRGFLDIVVDAKRR